MQRLLIVAALVLAACGSDDDGDGSSTRSDLEPLTWTWVPIEGAVCNDGSPTGIGVEPALGDGADVLVFLDGGGACWDALTCFTLGTATPGPFGEAELTERARALVPGSIFDRTLADNPYRDFTFVFVPYCTGDVHAGDAVREYPGAPAAWHHKGAANLTAIFDHLGSELDAPGRVVVSGASAGGFGALLGFDLARRQWPDARGYLVDDSGPPLEAIPDVTVAAWILAWELDRTVTPLCGAECLADLSLLFPAVAAKYPEDRLALLTSTQDRTMRYFFGDPLTLTMMSAATFESSVRALVESIEDAEDPGRTHSFVVRGDSHTMLQSPASFTSEGTPLLDWLRQQVDDDADWGSVVPPP